MSVAVCGNRITLKPNRIVQHLVQISFNEMKAGSLKDASIYQIECRVQDDHFGMSDFDLIPSTSVQHLICG